MKTAKRTRKGIARTRRTFHGLECAACHNNTSCTGPLRRHALNPAHKPPAPASLPLFSHSLSLSLFALLCSGASSPLFLLFYTAKRPPTNSPSLSLSFFSFLPSFFLSFLGLGGKLCVNRWRQTVGFGYSLQGLARRFAPSPPPASSWAPFADKPTGFVEVSSFAEKRHLQYALGLLNIAERTALP